jgi:aminoglycoside phosphotransferase (APT) family kinase protein
VDYLLHGDLHPANVLTADGTICGVIDFGDLFAGDPACDLPFGVRDVSGQPVGQLVGIGNRALPKSRDARRSRGARQWTRVALSARGRCAP